jgi:23S rRNA (guanosine2251-2'-O)-methyltransferase
MIIEGNVSVKAALMGEKREVQKIYVDEKKQDKDTAWILHRAEERHVAILRKKREEIDALASGRTHGGLLGECGPRRYEDKESTLAQDKTFVVLLEGVEDPFNLGYIMRTLYSAGCTGLILRQRNWENAESTILKSSAGASEYIHRGTDR